MIDPNTYEPQEPLKQMKGSSPATGALTYYRVDQNGVIIYEYQSSEQRWAYFKETSNGFAEPNDLTPAISLDDLKQIKSSIINSGLIKLKTDYLIIGDEPAKGIAVIDLKSRIGEEKYFNFKTLLRFLPRMYLRAWYDKNIKPAHDMLWAAIIDTFNEANLEHIQENNMTPWQWEEEKLKSYYLAENKPVLDELNAKFAAYKELNTSPDPQAQALMMEYQKIPKIGDQGLEISRQSAIKELLVRKEYEAVKGIIDAFRYAQYTILNEAIVKPIPFDLVVSGVNIKQSNQ